MIENDKEIMNDGKIAINVLGQNMYLPKYLIFSQTLCL